MQKIESRKMREKELSRLEKEIREVHKAIELTQKVIDSGDADSYPDAAVHMANLEEDLEDLEIQYNVWLPTNKEFKRIVEEGHEDKW